MERKYMVPVCPECGNNTIDPAYSLRPLESGVQCYQCGHVYPLLLENAKEVTEEEYRETIKNPGVFEHPEKLSEYKKRVGDV